MIFGTLQKLFVSICALIVASAILSAAEDAKPISFKNQIAPILVTKCQGCHGGNRVKGGFSLNTFDQLMTAGESKKLSPLHLDHLLFLCLLMQVVHVQYAQRLQGRHLLGARHWL